MKHGIHRKYHCDRSSEWHPTLSLHEKRELVEFLEQTAYKDGSCM